MFNGSVFEYKLWLSSALQWQNMQFTFVKTTDPELTDCLMSVLFACLFVIGRKVFEKYFVLYVADVMGFPSLSKISRVESNGQQIIETKDYHTPTSSVKDKATQARVNQQKGRKHRRRKSPSLLYKFTENGWHCFYYSCSFACGFSYVWSKPWLWDTTKCWLNWPEQDIPSGIYWMYQIQMGFYLSLVFAIIFKSDSRKKDRMLMITHHAVTLTLILASWLLKFMRIGVLVLVIHDLADPGIAISKMLWYSHRKQAAEKTFAFAIFIWILSRIVLFPLWIIRSTVFEARQHLNFQVQAHQIIYYSFNFLLMSLQLMHIFWTWNILEVVLQKFKHGELKKDARSESESEESPGKQTDYEQDNKNNIIAKKNI